MPTARSSYSDDLALSNVTAADTITQALDVGAYRPRDHGSYIQAFCPCHEDRREPSLTIYRKPGRIRIRCWAGCDDLDVLAALGLTPRDLYDEPRAPRSALHPFRVSVPRPKPQTPAERAPACLGRYSEHSYAPAGFNPRAPKARHLWNEWRTTAGERAWRVRIPCRRPGCTGRSFAWRKIVAAAVTFGKPAGLLPYRYPELRSAVSRGWSGPVLICEGESDTDAARAVGAQAITAGEAGAWGDRHTVSLLSLGIRRVIITADRDGGAGLRHARKVKAQLEAVGIRGHIVQAKAGKDVRDHLAAGYRLDELEEIGEGP